MRRGLFVELMTQPNVLVITTDQQRCDSMSCCGSEFTRTPHLDRLAREGVLFRRAYCANPVCTPARASLFSGRLPSRHGAWNAGMSLPQDQPLLSHRLAEAGYATHDIGKAHFQAYQAPLELSMESRLEGWQRRYESWHGPYHGFATVELCLGRTLCGMAGHYGLCARSQIGESQLRVIAPAGRGGVV